VHPPHGQGARIDPIASPGSQHPEAAQTAPAGEPTLEQMVELVGALSLNNRAEAERIDAEMKDKFCDDAYFAPR